MKNQKILVKKAGTAAVSLVEHSNAQDFLITLLFIVFAIFFFANLRNKEYSKIDYSQNQVAQYQSKNLAN